MSAFLEVADGEVTAAPRCPNCLHPLGGKWYCDGRTASEMRVVAAMVKQERSDALKDLLDRVDWDKPYYEMYTEHPS